MIELLIIKNIQKMELTKKNGAKIYVNIDNVLYTQNQYLNFQSGTLLEVADVDEVRFNNSGKYKSGFINVDKIESFKRYGAKTEVLFLTGTVISFEDFEVIEATKTTRKRTKKAE